MFSLLAGFNPIIPKFVGPARISVPSVIFLTEVFKLVVTLIVLLLAPLILGLYYRLTRTEKTVRNTKAFRLNLDGKLVEEDVEDSEENDMIDGSENRRSDMLRGLELGSWLRFGFIALMYVIVNNLKLYAIFLIDPGSFGMLNNIGIVITAVLYRIIMKRKSTTYQILALIILVLGLMTSKLTIILEQSPHIQPALTGNRTSTKIDVGKQSC